MANIKKSGRLRLFLANESPLLDYFFFRADAGSVLQKGVFLLFAIVVVPFIAFRRLLNGPSQKRNNQADGGDGHEEQEDVYPLW